LSFYIGFGLNKHIKCIYLFLVTMKLQFGNLFKIEQHSWINFFIYDILHYIKCSIWRNKPAKLKCKVQHSLPAGQPSDCSNTFFMHTNILASGYHLGEQPSWNSRAALNFIRTTELFFFSCAEKRQRHPCSRLFSVSLPEFPKLIKRSSRQHNT